MNNMKRVVYLITMFLLCIGQMAAQTAWDGTTEDFRSNNAGTAIDPYQINNAKQLAKIAELIAAGGEDFAGNYIVLTADLDLGGASTPPKQWIPIGTSTLAFAGNFDGQGHTIANLYIAGENDFSGLFGCIAGKSSPYNITAVVRNLGIIGKSSVSGGSNVGAFCGALYNCTIVENCYNTGTVSGVSRVGGLIGITGNAICDIRNCLNLGDVIGTGDEVGGVIGYHANYCKNVYNMGNVTGANRVGGLTGYSHAPINDSYNAGNVTASGVAGILCGETNFGDILPNSSYGDKQMCLQTLLTGNKRATTIETSVAAITSKMTDGEVFARTPNFSDPSTTWDTEIWEFTAGMYPRLKFAKDLAIVKLYATPVLLKATDDKNFETINTVKTNFTVGTGNSVSWASDKSSLLTISGGNATVIRPVGTPDNVNIIATSDGLTKKISLRVLPQPFTVTITNPANCNITVLDGERTVANGGTADYGSKLRFVAETEDGYMVSKFKVDGVDMSADNIVITKSITVTAEIVSSTANAWDGTASLVYGEGFGSEEKPYLIYTPQQLALLAKSVNAGNDYTGVYFKLAGDINLGGKASVPQQWVPIGNSIGGVKKLFKGSFDGGNNKISDLYINSNLMSYAGLFGYISIRSEVKNVYVVSGLINGSGMLGAIAGCNEGGTIKNCLSGVNITGGGANVGGIVGNNITSTGVYAVVDGCANFGNITGASSSVGGVVGANAMGENMVKNSYNSGRVSSTGVGLGGVVGKCEGVIYNCYNSGTVEGGSAKVGGVIGSFMSVSPAFDKCFFDKQMSLQAQAIGGAADSDRGRGLTTAGMTAVDIALDNSENVWEFEAGMYPRLKAMLNDVTKLYANPIFLQTEGGGDDMVCEVYNAIKTNFTVGTGGVAWTSNDAAIAISGANAAVDQSKSKNNDITLKATLSTLSRELIVTVYPLEVTVNVTEGENGVLSVLFDSKPIASGAKVPVYNKLIFVATPNEGYTLEAFTVNGEEVDGNMLMLTEESTVAAKFVKTDVVKAWDGTVAKFFGGGTGAAATPYLISTAEQLAYLGLRVNAGETFENQYFKMMNNLDLGGTTAKNWMPIGTETHKFIGKFDGNGKVVLNLNIDRADIDNVGLFGYIDYGCEISKLGIGGTSIIKGKNNVGAIVGYSAGKVMYCFNKANVTGVENVGGIVGNGVKGSIGSCYNRGAIAGTTIVGGIMGSDLGSAGLQSCYSDGDVTGTSYVGAVVGTRGNTQYITNCYYDNTKLTIKGIGYESSTSSDDATKVEGRTTAAMTDGTFAAILKTSWREDFSTNGINDKYPVLTWQVVTLTVGEMEHGGITINDVARAAEYTEEIAVGAILNLKAVAEDGYSFVEWWDGDTNAEREYTMFGNVTVSALFLKGIAVTVVVPENGSIKLEYDGQETTVTSSEIENVVIDVVTGSDLTMTAMANSDYHFLNWNNNESQLNPYTVKITEEREIAVAFDGNDVEYAVTIADVDESTGTISVKKDGVEITSGDTFEYGTVLTLKAEGVGEYDFIKWWDNSTEAERDLTIERAVDITALFEIVTYVVTVETTNGTIVVNNGSEAVNSGDRVKAGTVLTLSNTPATGYSFKGYLVNGATIEGNSVTVDKDVAISAKFEGVRCKVNIVVPEQCSSLTAMNGTEVVLDGTMLPYGTVLTLGNSTKFGYIVESYTANGEPFNGSTYTVKSEVVLSANIVSRTGKITIYQPEGGVITVKDGETVINDGDYVNYGITLTFFQETKPGYTFQYFTVDGYKQSNNERKVETTALAISGQYEIDSYSITLPTVEGATVAAASGYDAAKVKHDTDFKFKVTLNAAYSESQIVVKAGEELLTSTNGTYTISNVTADKIVTLTGVVKNTFAITIETPENGTVTVKNGNNVVNSGDKLEAGVKLTLEATPVNGDYELDYYTVDGFKIYGAEVIVSESITVSAQFKKFNSVESNEELKASVYSYGKTVYVQSEVNAEVTIFDMSGRLVLTSTVVEGVKAAISITNAGTYVVRLNSEGKVNATKVTIN